MEKLFLAYLVSNGNVIDKDRYDIIVREIGDNQYQELITRNIFENYKYSSEDISICLCFRIDSVLHYKYINDYLKYEEDRVKRIIESLQSKRLVKKQLS